MRNWVDSVSESPYGLSNETQWIIEMSKHHTVKAQKINYGEKRIMKSGDTYKAINGATVIVKEFFIDFEGGLCVSYSAMNPEMDSGKWAAGDTTPNGMYHWLWG